MTQRFFRSSVSVYESVRTGLDAAWNHRPDETAYMPAQWAPRDTQGRVYLAVDAEWCEYPAVAAILPNLLATGAVEEISREDYEQRERP